MVLRRPAKLVALSVLPGFLLITVSAAKAQWERISYIEWSPDGTMLAVSGGTTLHVVDAQTMEDLNTFYGLKDQFTAPSWSPDGNRLAIANGPEIQIWQEPWDVNNAQLVATFQSTARYIMSLAWNPNDDRIAVTDGALEVWDVSAPTPALLYSRTEHGMWIEQVAWSPTGDLLATASLDYTVKIWDSATGEVLSTMTVVTDLVSSSPSEFFAFATTVSWSPDESRLVFGAEDGSVRIWDRTRLSGSEVRTQYGDPGVFRQHEGAVWSVSWNPAQPEVASGSTDGTVRIWDVNTGELKQVISVGSAVGSVAWSPDGTRLAYGNENGSFEIVNTPPLPATPTATPDDVPGPTNAATTRAPQDVIREMAWKPDGSVLAVGNSDGTIDIRNSTTGAIEKHLTGHVGGITALA
jgi:WD40 repeat protein